MFKHPSYVISMKEINEKKKIKNYIKNNGFENIEIIDAIVGKNLNISKIPLSAYTRALVNGKLEKRSGINNHCKASLGCFLSHYKIWHLFLETDNEICAIFEDDVQFESHFKENFKQYLKDTKQYLYSEKPLFLQLGFCFTSKHKLIKYPEFSIIKGIFWGTQSYIINRECAKMLIKNVDFNFQVDSYISLQSNIFKLAPKKKLTTQNWSSSSIQTWCITCLLPTNLYFYISTIILFFIFMISTIYMCNPMQKKLIFLIILLYLSQFI